MADCTWSRISLVLGHGSQVFCNCVFSVKGDIALKFTLVFGGCLPRCQIFVLLFSYNLVWPVVVVVVCWTESQDKPAKGRFFWV